MQVSVETTNGLERRMTVEIPREKINTEIQTRLKSLAGRAKMPGFRPGKVPFNVIQKRYGGQVQKEVLGEMMQNSFYEAVTQENLHPAGMPHIEAKDDSDDTKDVAFTATFEVYPEIQLTAMEQIEIEKPVVEIADADIDKMVDTIRKQRKTWQAVERPAKTDDRVTIDFEGKIDGEVFPGGSGKAMPVELGTGRMIAGFEEQLEGVTLNEEKTLSLEFPAEYHQKDLAGKPVTFEVKVTQVEEPALPELDEEFVKSMGVSDGSMDTFRSQVKSNMEREAEQNISSKVKEQVLDQLLKHNVFDIPKVLLDSEIHNLMHQQQEQLGEQAAKELNPALFEEQARRRVALGLILSEIVKQNDIKVAPAKVRSIIDGIAASYEHPEEVVKYYYGDKQRLAEVENYALEGEVVDWVVSKASVTEKSVAFDELVNPGHV
jgi:trigger factor